MYPRTNSSTVIATTRGCGLNPIASIGYARFILLAESHWAAIDGQYRVVY